MGPATARPLSLESLAKSYIQYTRSRTRQSCLLCLEVCRVMISMLENTTILLWNKYRLIEEKGASHKATIGN